MRLPPLQATFERIVGQHAINTGLFGCGPYGRVASYLTTAGKVKDNLLAAILKPLDFFCSGNKCNEEYIQQTLFQTRLDICPTYVRTNTKFLILCFQPATGFVTLVKRK